ncbi:MAG: UbiX family flavin prenyltransferase [Pirellulales bacterium]|nr:UbiX family flavin prenyltransferase [Pirellulales bacterium]
MKPNIVVAITGASGAVYGLRLLETLLAAGRDVHLTISAAARTVLRQELDLSVDLEHFEPKSLALDIASREPGQLHYHHFRDLLAPIASGSFLTGGMAICPCSCGTLSAIACGAGANLIHRAADVHLKERRKLVLVPRETPLSLIILDNLRRAAEAGAVILPAMPGFYRGAKTVRDLVDFVVARICDQFAVEHSLVRRWGD